MLPVYLKDSRFRPPDDPIYYLVAANGIFLVKNHPLFHSTTQVSEVPWLNEETVHFRYRGPRLTKALLAQTLAFFVAVWERYRAESVVVLYYRPMAEEYHILVPRQTVGGIHVSYEESLPEDRDAVRAGTIHSHGREDAFHSDRDDEDESCQDGLHLIFGHVDAAPTLLCSAMVDGRRFPLHCQRVADELPARPELAPWAEWAREQMEKQVRPLKKPVYFGT